jgi:hypothetical protein
MIYDSTPLNIRVMLCVVALELLLLGSKQENLRYKLAERVALLVGDKKEWLKIYFGNVLQERKDQQVDEDFTAEQIVEARVALSRLTRTLYDKKSSFAHPSSSNIARIIL